MSGMFHSKGWLAVILGGLVIACAVTPDAGNANVSPLADSSAASASAVAPGGDAGEPEAGAASFEWSTLYASRYAFQGVDYSEGRPVIQPSASGSLRGFTLGLWGNADQARRELNEIDVTFQRNFEHGPLSAGLGVEYLRYPHREGWLPTHETYLDLALASPLQPSLSVHWDVDAGAGRYWTLGLGHEFKTPRTTFALSTRLYAHEHYYGMTGVPAWETALSLSTPAGPLILQPSLARTWAGPNGDFRGEFAIPPGWVLGMTVAPR